MREGLRVVSQEMPPAGGGRAVGMLIHPEQNRIRDSEKAKRAIRLAAQLSIGVRIGILIVDRPRVLPLAHIVQTNAFPAYRVT